jgi:hypothetical protein
MTAPRSSAYGHAMVDPEEIVLCEHGNDLGECQTCAGEIEARSRSIFDADAWAEAYEAEQPAPVTSAV